MNWTEGEKDDVVCRQFNKINKQAGPKSQNRIEPITTCDDFQKRNWSSGVCILKVLQMMWCVVVLQVVHHRSSNDHQQQPNHFVSVGSGKTKTKPHIPPYSLSVGICIASSSFRSIKPEKARAGEGAGALTVHFSEILRAFQCREG